MRILLSNDKLVGDLQKEFNEIFPYLKLEVYAPLGGHAPQIEDLVDSDTTLSAINELLNEQIFIEFSGLTTVQEFMFDIRNKAGISIRICRKFGRSWLPVVFTLEWALSRQNEQGKAISLH